MVYGFLTFFPEPSVGVEVAIDWEFELLLLQFILRKQHIDRVCENREEEKRREKERKSNVAGWAACMCGAQFEAAQLLALGPSHNQISTTPISSFYV